MPEPAQCYVIHRVGPRADQPRIQILPSKSLTKKGFFALILGFPRSDRGVGSVATRARPKRSLGRAPFAAARQAPQQRISA